VNTLAIWLQRGIEMEIAVRVCRPPGPLDAVGSRSAVLVGAVDAGQVGVLCGRG